MICCHHNRGASRCIVTDALPPIVATHNIIDDDIYFAQNHAEDIALVRNEGFEVGDNNTQLLKTSQPLLMSRQW
jgi:hypothetical protein